MNDRSSFMDAKRSIIFIPLFVVGLIASWYWLTPKLTLAAFHDAVEAGDEADIAELVDFASLREQVRDEVIGRAMLANDASASSSGLLILLNSAFGAAANPAGLENFFKNSGWMSERYDWTVTRNGWSSFKAQIEDNGKIGPQLVFHRFGWSWRLVAIYSTGGAGPGEVGAKPSGADGNADPFLQAVKDREAAAAARAEDAEISQQASLDAAAMASEASGCSFSGK